MKASPRNRSYRSHALGWIIMAHFDSDGVLHERAQSLVQSIRAFGLARASRHEANYVFTLEQCGPLVAVALAFSVRLPAKLLDDVSPNALRARFHPEIFKRIVVAYRQRVD
jgi:hypothetical protein